MRFPEHFCDCKYRNNKSKFAQHLLDNKHSTGPIENIMDILHVANKGEMLNTLKRFHIYNKTKIDIQINDKCTVRQNIILNMLILKYTNTGPSPL